MGLRSMLGSLLYRASVFSGGHPKDEALAKLLGGNMTAGVRVDETTALTVPTYYRCVSLIASTVASLPVHTYRRAGDDRDRAAHPTEALVNDAPNHEMDAFSFRETLMGHVLTWGNGYAEIERTNGGAPLYLWPIPPDRVTVDRDGAGLLRYRVRRDSGGDDVLFGDDVMHVRGLGFDGLVGYSVVSHARQTLALGIGAERAGSALMGNNSVPVGILSTPGVWSREKNDELARQWEERHKGPDRTGRPAVLSGGMTWQQLGLPFDDVQYIQTRKLSAVDICRFLDVPPHMAYDLDRATFSNIEEQGRDFVTYSLRKWLTRWEIAFRRALLSPAERDEWYYSHVTEDLVRADISKRYAAYNTGRNGGWLSVNEIRRRENLPPIDGGDEYLAPLNMRPAGGDGASVEGAGVPAPDSEIGDAAEQAFVDAFGRAIDREVRAVRHRAKQPASFLDRIEAFYESHQGALAKELGASTRALAIAVGSDTDPFRIATDHCDESRRLLLDAAGIATPKELLSVIEKLTATWPDRACAASQIIREAVPNA